MIEQAFWLLPEIFQAATGAFIIALLAVTGGNILHGRQVRSQRRLGALAGGIFGAILIVVPFALLFTVITLRAIGHAGIAHGGEPRAIDATLLEVYPVLVFVFCVPGFVLALEAMERFRTILSYAQYVAYGTVAAFVAIVVVSTGLGMPEAPDPYTPYPPFDVALVLFPALMAILVTYVSWLALAHEATTQENSI